MPSSNVPFSVCSTHSAQASGAIRPRLRLFAAAAASVKILGSAFAAASLESSSRTRFSGRFSAITLRRKRLAGLRRIAFEQLVDQADLQALVALDRLAGDDHLHGLRRTDHARQPLRAAGARQQAELHFGQAEVGVLGGDAEVAAQRGFETAAERIAVDRGNDGARRVLQQIENFMQARRLRRLAELADVGAAR